MYEIDYEAGISNVGKYDKLVRLFERAKAGESLTIGMIGGSITQGCLSSVPETCYAYRVYRWWQKTFPNAEFKYVNGGIGGTNSHYGSARAVSDLLRYEPDFVIVEFSVNDDSNEFFEETYEGLVRKIIKQESEPFVMLVHTVHYNSGMNAQYYHSRIARYYELPAVSMQSTLYPKVVSGEIPLADISTDALHPNDLGHEIMANVICYLLEKVMKNKESYSTLGDGVVNELKAPKTPNCYENAYCIKNDSDEVILDGFTKMTEPQSDITDCFKNGWRANKKGATLKLSVKASEIAISFRQTIKGPAPIARVTIDDKPEYTSILDANYDETWGDNLELRPIMVHGKNELHEIKVELIDCPENTLDFELINIVCSN